MWNLEASIKSAVQEVNSKWGKHCQPQHQQQEGYGHQNWDPMDAWDITITVQDVKAACDIMHMVAVQLAYFNPLPGYCFSLVHFDDFLAPLFEFSNSDAIVALKQKGYVVWSYFVITNMAIIDWKGKVDDGEKLDQALQVCIAHNKEQTKIY